MSRSLCNEQLYSDLYRQIESFVRIVREEYNTMDGSVQHLFEYLLRVFSFENLMAKDTTVRSEDDFDLMGDMPKEDPAIAKRRLARENEITKKLGEYLLKGYCMLGDTCEDCNCILLRTPDKQLFCVGCEEIDVEKKNEDAPKKKKKNKKNKKDQSKKLSKGNEEIENEVSYSDQLENKLKWAVDELTKSQNPHRINEMCSVVIKLTEALKALKEFDRLSSVN